jgi:Arc/MetJ-type ribon-helix-helix transcriptional regulator
MKARKERLTVTVDPELLNAVNRAVVDGAARSLSAWVNEALSERLARERRIRALAEAIAAYESEAGVITPEELAAQQRDDRAAAIVVRRPRPRSARAVRRRPA